MYLTFVPTFVIFFYVSYYNALPTLISDALKSIYKTLLRTAIIRHNEVLSIKSTISMTNS